MTGSTGIPHTSSGWPVTATARSCIVRRGIAVIAENESVMASRAPEAQPAFVPLLVSLFAQHRHHHPGCVLAALGMGRATWHTRRCLRDAMAAALSIGPSWACEHQRSLMRHSTDVGM